MRFHVEMRFQSVVSCSHITADNGGAREQEIIKLVAYRRGTLDSLIAPPLVFSGHYLLKNKMGNHISYRWLRDNIVNDRTIEQFLVLESRR